MNKILVVAFSYDELIHLNDDTFTVRMLNTF